MRDGLLSEPKELGAVWLYDERGSRLYEEVTRLPEYYLPRREAEILRTHSADIAETGARTLIELGSGNTGNTRLLLDALSDTLERFVPVGRERGRPAGERRGARGRLSRPEGRAAGRGLPAATSTRCPTA